MVGNVLKLLVVFCSIAFAQRTTNDLRNGGQCIEIINSVISHRIYPPYRLTTND
jgi:hypothetical protein